MGAIDVAVFAFDMDERLVLVNPAGERLLGQAAPRAARAPTRRSCASPNCLDGRHAAAARPAVRPRERPPRAAALDLPPRRQAASAARLRRSQPRAARGGAAGLAAHRPRAVARDQQLADADQVDRAQHQADDLARAGHAARRRDPGRPEPDRDAVGRARAVPPRLRAARAAAEAAAEELPGDARSRTASPSWRTGCRSRCTASDDVEINADPDQLEQLLINIVRNAVDATLETGGQVWIDWKPVDGSLQLTVEDEGPGLPDTSNLFVPFFTTKPAGSGIGLALSAGRSPKRTAARSRWRTGPRVAAAARSCGCRCSAAAELPKRPTPNSQTSWG